ncbi:hypothetical protein D3C87_2163730 [compost metagenome]
MALYQRFFFDQRNQHLDGFAAEDFGGLRDGCQRGVAVSREGNVVKTDQRNILGHP